MTSILMAYYERLPHLTNTLLSFKYFYAGRDFELVVIDDGSPTPIEPTLAVFREHFPIQYERVDRPQTNPGTLYNRAAELARGDVLVVQNPENVHLGDILGAVDETIAPGRYICFACRTFSRLGPFAEMAAFPNEYTNHGELWHGMYQHSVHFNRLLHFCAALTKADYLALGGFDPAYDDGHAYEDNDFAERVVRALEVVTVDFPEVAHQPHARPGQGGGAFPHRDYARNAAIFAERWKRDPAIFEQGRGKGLRLTHRGLGSRGAAA